MGLKACLFDMDGVIVDSAVHHFVAWRKLADELSIPFAEEDNHALKGLSRVDSLDHILRMGHLELDEKTKLKKDMLAYCKLDTLAMVKIYEKMKEFS